MDPIQNNPFALRIASAYGVGPTRAVYPVQPVRPASPVQGGTTSQVSGRAGVDTVELSRHVAARERIAGLVAAQVPGSIDFTVADDGVSAPGQAGALQLFRRPADLNAAATGVTMGRALDLQA